MMVVASCYMFNGYNEIGSVAEKSNFGNKNIKVKK